MSSLSVPSFSRKRAADHERARVKCADEEDPHEFVNLATQPQYAALMKELFTELQEMLEEAR